MDNKQDPSKYRILYQILVVFNILYYVYEIKMQAGIFDLMPSPIETHHGLVMRLPYIYLCLNLVLLLHCLFINHWYVVVLYVSVLLFEMILAIGFEHIFMVGYSAGQTIWGGVILLFYGWYRLIKNQNGH